MEKNQSHKKREHNCDGKKTTKRRKDKTEYEEEMNRNRKEYKS